MPNTTLDKAIAAVPKFRDRISLFTKKLRLAQYADGSIYDYRLKIAQAVLFFKKLPEEFTQTDIDYYLSGQKPLQPVLLQAHRIRTAGLLQGDGA